MCAVLRFSCVLIAGLIFGTSVAAERVTYLCEMEREDSGYIQPMIGLGYDAETGDTFAFDAIIAQNNKTALKAYLAEDTDKRVVIAWRVLFRNSWGQTAHLAFNARIDKATGRATVTAAPSGYRDRFLGRGKCSLTDIEIPGIG